MKESIESRKEIFTFPDIEAERGEFERVAEKFGLDTEVLMMLALEEGRLESLGEGLWTGLFGLDNTSSKNIGLDNWEGVVEALHEDGVERNWEELRDKIMKGEVLDAPIILKMGGLYHLVSGNTRLMVARTLGITPKVLFFEYTHNRTNEK
jgi:hypothetical protein